MNKIFLLAFVLVLGLNSACARPSRTPTDPPPSPTAIVYPATWTPETTPLPPTGTPRPPTNTPDPATLQVLKAFERTRDVRVFHATIDIIVNDPSGSLTKSFPGVTAGDSVTVLSMEGRQNFEDSSWKIKGLIVMFLSGNPDDQVEFLTIGQRMYLHGPLPMFGAREDRWYYAPKSASRDLADSTPNEFLKDLSGAGNGIPAMRANGAESLDNKSCVKYSADEREAAQFFQSLNEGGSIKRNLGTGQGNLERGVLHVWVCEDGYVHKMEMGIQMRAPEAPNQIAAIGFTVRLNDMNIIVPLQEPKDAIPLPDPFVIPGLSEPAKTATPPTF